MCKVYHLPHRWFVGTLREIYNCVHVVSDNNRCPDPSLNKFYLALGLIILIGCVLALSYINRNKTGSPPQRHSVLLKILLSATQLNMLAARFDFKWPDNVQQWFDIALTLKICVFTLLIERL
jgi:hypothetical protein